MKSSVRVLPPSKPIGLSMPVPDDGLALAEYVDFADEGFDGDEFVSVLGTKELPSPPPVCECVGTPPFV